MKKKKLIQRCIIVTIVLLIAIISTLFLYSKKEKELEDNKEITISLNGEESLELNVFSEYEELGAIAKYDNQDVSDEIKVTGEVNKDVPGTYILEYNISHDNKESTIKRTINVVDKEKPVITLNGDKEQSIYIGEAFKEPGYKALDNVDKDITENVIVNGEIDNKTIGEYILTYTVNDSSNNSISETRKIKVIEKPVITVQETKPQQIHVPTTSGGGLPVLMYHFFYDASKGQTGNDANWMEIGAFEEQMKYLSDNNYYFPTWDEVLAYVNGTGTLPEKSILVTIDDGDITFIDLAIPIIEKYNVKAVSFAVASWNGDWLPKTYSSTHLDFQSHSYDAHRAGANGRGRLVNMTYQEALNDVTKSRDIIGNVKVFCYPFGHYNDTAIQVLKDANYTLAFTTKYGRVYPGANPYALPRIRMSRGDSLQTFVNKIA